MSSDAQTPVPGVLLLLPAQLPSLFISGFLIILTPSMSVPVPNSNCTRLTQDWSSFTGNKSHQTFSHHDTCQNSLNFRLDRSYCYSWQQSHKLLKNFFIWASKECCVLIRVCSVLIQDPPPSLTSPNPQSWLLVQEIVTSPKSDQLGSCSCSVTLEGEG